MRGEATRRVSAICRTRCPYRRENETEARAVRSENGERRVDVVEFCRIAIACGAKPPDVFQRFVERAARIDGKMKRKRGPSDLKTVSGVWTSLNSAASRSHAVRSHPTCFSDLSNALPVSTGK